jgi:hypothetical protein
VAEPDLSKSGAGSDRAGNPWRRRAITLLLLLAVIATGMAVFSSRQEWRELYLSYIGSW